MRKSVLRVLAVLLAFTFVAAACGSDDSGSSSSTTEGSGSDSGIPDTFPEPTEPVKGGRLIMNMDANIDCYSGLSYYGISWSLFYFMARGLYGYPNTVEAPETSTIRADLAADLPEVSDDGLTYTVKLREGLTFPDGSPVTSADVKATYEYMLDKNIQCSTQGPPSSGYYDVIEGVAEYQAALEADPKAWSTTEISGIEATDELTTTFTLTEPSGAFIRALAMGWSFIVPADTPHAVTETPPPFVGPYSITDYELDKQLTIDRQDSWEDNVAAGVPEEDTENNIEGIDMTIGVPPDIQLASLKENEIDISFDSAAPQGSDIPAVVNDPAYEGRVFSVPDAAVNYGIFRTDKAPFDNVELRQAVNWAIDRENLVKISGGALTVEPWAEILSRNLMVGAPGADGDVYSYDEGKAKEMVEASGVATPIKVTVAHYADSPWPQLAASIQENLEAVGFEVELTPVSADVYQGFLADKASDYNIGFTAWGQDFPDAITFFLPLLTCPGGTPTGQNNGWFCDEEFDASVKEIGAMPDGPERQQAFAELSTSTAKDKAPWFTTQNQREVSFVSDRVGNFSWGPNKNFYFANYFIKDGS